MKRGILFILCLLLLSMPFALAQEEEVDAGVTPDSPFYALDKAMDRISLALTFDKARRSEKALQIAEERLQELFLVLMIIISPFLQLMASIFSAFVTLKIRSRDLNK